MKPKITTRADARRADEGEADVDRPSELSEQELEAPQGGDGRNECARLTGSTNVFRFGGNG